MTHNHTSLGSAGFKPKALVLAVRRALPLLVALSLSAAVVSPAVGRSGDNAAAFTATQLIRQFTLKNTVAQVSQGMQGYVQEVNGVLRAPAMGVAPSGFPVGMGSVPGTVNLPRRDGAGRPLGYCAWDNSSSTSDANFLAGFGVANPLAYAVISPGLNGAMETTCAQALATGTGQGDDFVQVTAPAQTSSKQFKSAVSTNAELQATPAEEGDVRLVMEDNKLYSYLGGMWVPVDGSNFADDSATNGAGAIRYTTGTVTVAGFQATTAAISGALTADSGTFANNVTAGTFTGNGLGLTDLSASNINSGVLGAAFGGTGVDGSAAAQGSLLIGTGAGFALGGITAGDGIGVLNGAGSITISNTGVLSITGTADQIAASASNGDVVLSLPQGIATTSTPTFAGMMLNGGLTAGSATFTGAVGASRVDVGTTAGVSFMNTIVGINAMAGAQSGGGANVALGWNALRDNTSGAYNVALGTDAMQRNTTGEYNVAVGRTALRDNSSGAYNTAVGDAAMQLNTTGYSNTAVGNSAMVTNTTGYRNTAVGRSALSLNTTGRSNTAVGYFAMLNNTTGEQNTAVGDTALQSNTSGYHNTAIGFAAMITTSTGYRNTAVGRSALNLNTTGRLNTAVGGLAMVNNTTGEQNTAVGADSLHNNTIGYRNTAVGNEALRSNDTGYHNNAFGYLALYSNTTGYENNAFGARALQDNTTGIMNVAMGDEALSSNTTGSYSTSIGSWALRAAGAAAGANTAMGSFALDALTSGFNNVAVGLEAGSNNPVQLLTSGSNNTFLGSYSGSATGVPTLNFGTAIGAFAVVGTDNTIVLGRTSDTTVIGAAGTATSGILLGKKLQVTGDIGATGNFEIGGTFTAPSATFTGAVGASRVDVGTTAGVTFMNTIVGINAMAGAQSGGGANVALGWNALQDNTSGAYNVALGTDAMQSNTTGEYNVAVGRTALRSNSTGLYNTAVGDAAMQLNTTGYSNTAIGQAAMVNNTIGISNTALGVRSLQANTTGSENTSVGAISLFRNTTGTRNTALGWSSLNNNTTGANNVALGAQSLRDSQTGSQNVAIGAYSMLLSNSGGRNNAVGYDSLLANTAGNANNAFGVEALESTTASNNSAFGERALMLNTTGANNVAFGRYAGYADAAGLATNANTTGSNNTFLGASAMPGTTVQLDYATALGADSLVTTSNTIALGRTTDTTVIGATGTATSGVLLNKKLQVTGDIGATGNFEIGGAFTAPSATFTGAVGASRVDVGTTAGVTYMNTIVGVNALMNAQTGDGANVAVGRNALQNNSSGAYNTAVGLDAMAGNTTGSSNTALGQAAMVSNTTGFSNTAVGVRSLQANTTGWNNTALGMSSLFQNTTGIRNTAVGVEAMQSNTTGGANVAMGDYALYGNQTGAQNVAIGVEALQSSNENNNSALGDRALKANTTGYANVAFGRYAGYADSSNSSVNANTTGNNNTFIGSYAMPGTATQLTYATALGADSRVTTASTIALGRTSDTTVIGATGTATTGVLQNKKLQVTGDIGATGNFEIGGTFTAPSATFTGAVTASRLNVGTATGVTYMNTIVGIDAMAGAQSGSGANVAFGPSALRNNSTGAYNIAVGRSSLSSNTVGRQNIAIGDNALRNNTTGAYNTAVGDNSLSSNLDGFDNVAIGDNAMDSNTSGFDNTAVGTFALRTNTTGSFNVAVGLSALEANLSGSYNTAIGTASMVLSSGNQSVAVGAGALKKFTGRYHAALGNAAFENLVGGEGNSALGHFAMLNLVTGSNNIAIGHQVGNLLATGDANIMMGTSTGDVLTSGSNNTLLGVGANSSGPVSLNYATALGSGSLVGTNNTIVLGRTSDTTVIGATGTATSGVLLNKKLQVTGDIGATGNFEIGGTFTAPSATFTGAVGASRVDVGTTAGVSFMNTIVGINALAGAQSGNGANVALGASALQANTSGASNTAVGTEALQNNSTGNFNVAVGRIALRLNTTGSSNTAVGESSLSENTTGSNNVALGLRSLAANTTGNNNSAVGLRSLQSNTTGFDNTAVGLFSMSDNSTGARNTALGRGSISGNTTGLANVAVGIGAGAYDSAGVATNANTTGSSNTFLGSYAMPGTATQLTYATALGADSRVTTASTIALGRTIDTTVIGATGTATSGVLLNKKLQVTGDIGATGNFEIGGTFTAPSATFTGAVGASRLDVGTMAGVTGANTIIGLNAMEGVQSGFGNNVAVGPSALRYNTTGAYNSAVGLNALLFNTTGSFNNAFGQNALAANTTGSSNTALGQASLFVNTTGYGNSAVGVRSLQANTSGYFNVAIGERSLQANTTGYVNIAIGTYALDQLTSGKGNVAVGADTGSKTSGSGYILTSGSDNTFIGDSAGPAFGVSTLNFATALGAQAEVGTNNTIVLGRTSDTTVIGATGTATSGVLLNKKLQVTGSIGATGNFEIGGTFTAPSATFTGALSASRLLLSDTSGGVLVGNLVVGTSAMQGVATGNGGNTALGISALRDNTSGYYNTAVGQRTLTSNTTGSRNIAMGLQTLDLNTTGTTNVALGVESLKFNVTGSNNTAVGDSALFTTSGNANTAIGNQALFENTTGINNVALGSGAGGASGSLVANTTGNNNTFLGTNARLASGTQVNYATALGSEAAVSTDNTIVLGRTTDTTVIGATGTATSGTLLNKKLQVTGDVGFTGRLDVNQLFVNGTEVTAGGSVTLAAINTATSVGTGNFTVGTNAMSGSTAGVRNTTVGQQAGRFLTTGSNENAAFGFQAMNSMTSGDYNTAMGAYALSAATTATDNVAIGTSSLQNTTGNSNTAVGTNALLATTSGAYNVALGVAAGYETSSGIETNQNTSGSYNTFVGSYALPGTTTQLTYATALGSGSSVTTSSTVVLGRASDTVIIGATGNDASGNKLQVTGSVKATAFNTSSDRRLKNSITQLDGSNMLSQLEQLNAYHYRFNNDPTGKTRYGVIAQEVATLFPHAVSYDGLGLMAVDYGALGAIAASAVGQLNTKVTAIDKQVKTNTDNITGLTERMDQSDERIDALESWKTKAVGRMDTMQSAIDKNIVDIAKNAVAITANTQRIDTLDEVTAVLDARTSEQGSLIAVLQSQWADTFSREADGQTLVVNTPNLKASNFTAQQASIGTVYSERLIAEMAKIKALEVDKLLVNSAQARTVRAGEVNTGSAQVYAGVGLPALLFAAPADGHYTVNTSSLDGSYATATVIVNAGQAKIVPVASEGIELIAEGNTVKAIAAGKSIKASWIKMG